MKTNRIFRIPTIATFYQRIFAQFKNFILTLDVCRECRLQRPILSSTLTWMVSPFLQMSIAVQFHFPISCESNSTKEIFCSSCAVCRVIFY